MYGARARIGLIVPANNTVCEPEMAALCPEGVNTYSTRIPFEPSLRGLRAMKNDVERASLELSSENISQIIVFCCTVGSLIGGPDYDREIIELIERKTATPGITTTTAVKAALDALKVKKIAVATPYTLEIDRLEASVLEQMGYSVTRMIGYHEHVPPEAFKNEMIGWLLPEVAYQLALKVNGKENEAIFISCTNFRAIEIIQRLEDETGKPVISSNQAAFWCALRKLGLKDQIKGYGRLLEQH